MDDLQDNLIIAGDSLLLIRKPSKCMNISFDHDLSRSIPLISTKCMINYFFVDVKLLRNLGIYVGEDRDLQVN